MSNIDVANLLVFRHLNIQTQTPEDRQLGQKKIYLLQKLGTNLGYAFIWWINGPTSDDVIKYMYQEYPIFENAIVENELAQEAAKNIVTINHLIDDIPNYCSNTLWYELLSSIVYASEHHKAWKIENTQTAIIDELIKLKQYDQK